MTITVEPIIMDTFGEQILRMVVFVEGLGPGCIVYCITVGLSLWVYGH